MPRRMGGFISGTTDYLARPSRNQAKRKDAKKSEGAQRIPWRVFAPLCVFALLLGSGDRTCTQENSMFRYRSADNADEEWLFSIRVIRVIRGFKMDHRVMPAGAFAPDRESV